MNESDKILIGAAQLFMRIGIKSVSMDDIAREIGISKKTIYKNFKDKKELVKRVIESDITQEMKACHECYDSKENAIQKMINLSRHISHRHRDTNPTVIYDLQKYYPSEWSLMENFRTDFIQNAVLKNIKEGINEGLYRIEINTELTSQMYVTLIQGIISLFTLPDKIYKFKDLHVEMVSYHLHAICTSEGKSYLDQHINEIID